MIESISTVWNKETNILTRTYPNPNPNPQPQPMYIRR